MQKSVTYYSVFLGVPIHLVSIGRVGRPIGARIRPLESIKAASGQSCLFLVRSQLWESFRTTSGSILTRSLPPVYKQKLIGWKHLPRPIME